MVKFYLFLGLIAMIPFEHLYAQEVSSKDIPPVVVESNRVFFSEDLTARSIGLNTVIEAGENIAHVLEIKSPVLIRNYGPTGSLASISMHGTGSNHTQVTWNGIPLNSPTTGQADLSLLPAGIMQSIEVINGASGSLFGSGTFGGTVNLNNEPDWSNRLSVRYTINTGSFGQTGHLFTARAGSRKFQYQLSALTSKAKNDFTFRDQYRINAPLTQNKHNAYNDLGILQNIYLNLNKGNYIEAGLWYQHKTLEIPPLMGSYKPSFANQKDSLFKSFLHFRKTGTKYALAVRTAYFSDCLQYTDKSSRIDSVYSLNSRIAASRVMSEADYRYYISSFVIAGGGLTFTHVNGNSNNYGGRISENEFAVYGNLKFVVKELIINAGLRKEFYEGLNPDPQYSLGARYNVNDRIIVRTSLSSKFRKPTINEKYWRPGGNPNLKPEKGRGGEITIEWNTGNKDLHRIWLSGKVTGYFQTVDNWIQWIIRDSLTPVEYKKVHTGGIETWIEYGFNAGIVTFKGHLNHNYNRAAIKNTFDHNPLYQGNQLIYTPKHSVRTYSELSCKGFFLSLAALYTGERETVETADAALRLPPFLVMNCSFGIQKEVYQIPLGLHFRIDNLLDQSYEMIRSYPLPGRSFHLSLSLGFNKRATAE